MSQDSKKRFDRIVAILIQLQSQRIVRAQELADRFQVSLRTIYRDIRSLEAAGVPVAGEAGVGYFITDGYRLPPVMFSREEAASFVAAEKLMQKFTDANLRRHYASALFKVKSVLRGQEKDYITALESHIHTVPLTAEVPDALGVFFDSIAERKQVEITYQAFDSDDIFQRHIEPVGLFHERSFWHVIGYCHLRKDYRQFRTDRILSIARTHLPFTIDHHPPMEELRSRTESSPDVRVVIRVKKPAVRYLRHSRKFYGFVSEVEKDGKVEMTFMTWNGCEGLARWYLTFGDHAEIVEPEFFREMVRELASTTLERL